MIEKNIEELLVGYMDGELDAREKQELLSLMEKNPALLQELKLLEQTRLMPDENIRFFNKELLLKPAGRSRKQIWYYRWPAAAAMLIAGVLFYLLNETLFTGRADMPKIVAVAPIQPELAASSGRNDKITENESKHREIQQNEAVRIRRHVHKDQMVNLTANKAVDEQENRKFLSEAVTINRGVLLQLPPPVISVPAIMENDRQIGFIPAVPGEKGSLVKRIRSKAGQLAGSALYSLSGRLGSPHISVVKEEVDKRTVYTFSFENNKVKYTGKF